MKYSSVILLFACAVTNVFASTFVDVVRQANSENLSKLPAQPIPEMSVPESSPDIQRRSFEGKLSNRKFARELLKRGLQDDLAALAQFDSAHSENNARLAIRQGRGPNDGRRGPDDGRGGPEEGRRGPEEGRGGPEEGRRGPEEGRRGPEEGRRGPEEGRRGPEEGRRGPRDVGSDQGNNL